MSMLGKEQRAPRVLFFGMQSQFSSPALSALLENGIEVCAIVIPSAALVRKQQPVMQRMQPPRTTTKRTNLALAYTPAVASYPTILQTAWAEQLPVWEVQRLSAPETLEILASYQADMICVACFSLIIPRVIIELFPHGCLNVHPSLLPANRGPVPLFWTFREGHAVTGVTIHRMNERLDRGAILAQEEIAVVEGMHIDQLEAECAKRGGQMLARSVWDLIAGRAEPREQDETQSSTHTFPEDEDFVVDVREWSAKHVYNFICGIRDWSRPIELQAGMQHIIVRRAISYSQNNDEYVEEVTWHGNREVSVRCRDGWVRVAQEPFMH